ncbi:MAG: ATP-grasp domain-containing protein [Eubacteriales bacterium]|nr:ATP-grasp domain-containing protein [Eubacteriales bacterium]
MNFIFISPGFPNNYYRFCQSLKKDGVNVLGIGDMPYDQLNPELIKSLTEYYRVNDLGNYEEMRRAVAFFIFKYGKIDWLESNNEYWLEQDARLRTDFNITTGWKEADIAKVKYKSQMKKYYEIAGVKTARWHLVDNEEDCLDFIKEVSYPVIVKPNCGVGASHTYRLKNKADLDEFFKTKDKKISYIMEEYVDGTITTFDGVTDNLCEPLYYASYSETDSLMDVVNENKDTWYFVKKDIEPELIEAGKRTLLAFGCYNRYFHLEFFKANSDKPGRWKKGEIIALEVNMRPAGGYTPDMESYSGDVDLYQIWADMITKKLTHAFLPKERNFCVYAAKRAEYSYAHSDADIKKKYAANMKMSGEIPFALQNDLGKDFYMALFPTFDEVLAFESYVLEKVKKEEKPKPVEEAKPEVEKPASNKAEANPKKQ